MKNRIWIEGGTAYMEAPRAANGDTVVIMFDAQDVERVCAYAGTWRAVSVQRSSKTHRVVGTAGPKGSKAVYLHRYILDCPKGRDVVHLNRNTFDLRRANLAIVPRPTGAEAANAVRIEGDTAYVELRDRGGAISGEALIDAEDAAKVLGLGVVWRNSRMRGEQGYVRANRNLRAILLHRVVLDAPEGQRVDHINGDKLDNRKRNLRPATHEQNVWNSKTRADNTSGARGVSWRADRGRWQARIAANGKRRSLGFFGTVEEASAAYDAAAAQLHGEFARLNEASGEVADA